MPVLAGARVRVPRCSGTKGASEGRNLVYTEKWYELRVEFPGQWFLPHGVVHRGSAVGSGLESLATVCWPSRSPVARVTQQSFVDCVCGFLR